MFEEAVSKPGFILLKKNCTQKKLVHFSLLM